MCSLVLLIIPEMLLSLFRKTIHAKFGDDMSGFQVVSETEPDIICSSYLMWNFLIKN